VSGPASARVLEFQPVEKPWGPDFLKFDFGLASTGDGALHANLRADHTRTWINQRGGRWQNALQLGRQAVASSTFYQPLDTAHRYFVEPSVAFERYIEDLYLDTERAADDGFVPLEDVPALVEGAARARSARVAPHLGQVANSITAVRRIRHRPGFRTGRLGVRTRRMAEVRHGHRMIVGSLVPLILARKENPGDACPRGQ